MQLKVLRVLWSLCAIVSTHVTHYPLPPTRVDQRPPVKYRCHFIAFVCSLGIKLCTDEDDLTAPYASQDTKGMEGRVF